MAAAGYYDRRTPGPGQCFRRRRLGVHRL